MNKYTAISFVVGTAVGSVVAWQLTKRHYEQIIQAEVDAVKEAFRKQSEYVGPQDADEAADESEEEDIFIGRENDEPERPGVAEYAKRLGNLGYTDYTKPGDETEEEEAPPADIPGKITKRPYVIPPEEFGESGYQMRELTYYADKVLADDEDLIVHDVDFLVGLSSLNHFGEYEEQIVHVRNDTMRCDFEICLDLRRFSDVVEQYPYKAGV